VRYLLITALLVSVTACATSGDFDALNRDISTLKTEATESGKDMAAVRKEIDILKEKTAGTVKEDSFSAVRESQADITLKTAELSSGLQELRGRFEESRYYNEKTLKDVSADKEILRAQMANIETQLKAVKDKLAGIEEAIKAKEVAQKTEEPRPEAEKTSGAVKPETGSKTAAENAGHEPAEKKSGSETATKIYDEAYQDFKDRKYKEAREKFAAFIKDRPANDLTDNAQFWIGETYYAEKDYESAILEYEKLLKQYPDSDKTAGALLKQGLAFIEISDNKTGKTILTKLIERFPSSKEAATAKKKIAETEKKPVRKR